MVLVIDDHLLIDLLGERLPGSLRSEMEGSIVYTTGAWYYRVASAVRRGSGNGALSSRLASLSGTQQAVVIGNLGLLPSRVGLIGPRVLVPVMAGSKLVAGRTCSLQKLWQSRSSQTPRSR